MKAFIAIFCVAAVGAQMPHGMMDRSNYFDYLGMPQQQPNNPEMMYPPMRNARNTFGYQNQNEITTDFNLFNGGNHQNYIRNMRDMSPRHIPMQMQMNNQYNPMENYNNRMPTMYTLRQLYNLPIFQTYLSLPLFQQYMADPAFQQYLLSPDFQQYFTHPTFLQFFVERPLFYKYIYPIVMHYQYNQNQMQMQRIEPQMGQQMTPEMTQQMPQQIYPQLNQQMYPPQMPQQMNPEMTQQFYPEMATQQMPQQMYPPMMNQQQLPQQMYPQMPQELTPAMYARLQRKMLRRLERMVMAAEFQGQFQGRFPGQFQEQGQQMYKNVMPPTDNMYNNNNNNIRPMLFPQQLNPYEMGKPTFNSNNNYYNPRIESPFYPTRRPFENKPKTVLIMEKLFNNEEPMKKMMKDVPAPTMDNMNVEKLTEVDPSMVTLTKEEAMTKPIVMTMDVEVPKEGQTETLAPELVTVTMTTTVKELEAPKPTAINRFARNNNGPTLHRVTLEKQDQVINNKNDEYILV